MNSEKEKSNQQIIDLLYQIGMTYLEKGDYNNAITRFKTLLELGEQSEKLYLNLSKAYILKEQFDHEALEIFEKTLQFDRENPVLNVILSQFYLKSGREDEHAMQVYQNALKQNPENADEIIFQLVKISIRQDNLDTLEGMMEQLIKTPEKIVTLFPIYVGKEWQNHRFDQVSQFLTKVFAVQNDLSWYRWFVINLLQAEQQLGKPLEISPDEFNFCSEYLNRSNSFDQLIDIYLNPAAEQLVTNYAEKIRKVAARPIEEYELFLIENSFSNIWEKGLNKKNPELEVSVPAPDQMWKKLKTWPPSETESAPATEIKPKKSKKSQPTLNEADTLMVVRMKGMTTDAIHADLWNAITTASGDEDNFLQGYQSNDGVILFWKDMNCPIQSAIQFLKNKGGQNGLDGNDKFHLQVLIHKLSPKKKGVNKDILNDLQLTLSTFQLEKDLFQPRTQSEPSENGAACQVLITSSVQEQLNGDIHFSVCPVDLIAQHPLTKQNLKIYQLLWDDAIARISRGEIKNIGRFGHLRELHSNRLFASFRAIDSFLERLVVIKILRPNLQMNMDQRVTSELFIQKAKILGKLTHQNIALIYDIGEEKDFCYIAREYVEGDPFKVQLLINQKVNWKRTLKLCHSISQTLAYAHDKDIFHGRLKPNNIFVTTNSEVKIADFQIVPFAAHWKSCQEPSLKSLTYLAPEQINQEPIDHRTDIFSLGVLMYEFLTDHNPFSHSNKEKIIDQILTLTPAPVTDLNPELPEKLNDVIFKAIEKSPDKRYANIHELENQLIEIIEAANS